MAKLQPVRGTMTLGEDVRRHRHVVETACSGRTIRIQRDETPIFELMEVFACTLGETSDVVSKEMYSFTDRGNESITLRPEGTAGVARAFISGGPPGIAEQCCSIRGRCSATSARKRPSASVPPDRRRSDRRGDSPG